MKIRDYRTYFIAELSTLFGDDEAESFFYLTLDDFLGWKRSDLALNPDSVFSDDELSKWNSVLGKLKKEIPIQYILGKAHFFGLEFVVNENVLIPRPETEELVGWIISDNKKDNPRILDIGTGSGCIAVSLAVSIENSNVSAIDVSERALDLAKKNAVSNKANVNFICRDILAAENLDAEYDIIVSNPPYVRHLEKHEIKKNVLDNEPHLALFVDDEDALIFYRKIAELAMENLSGSGKLFFEINQYLAKETMDLLENIGFSRLELRKDIYGNDRMILAQV